MCHVHKHLSETSAKTLKVLLTIFNLIVTFSNIACIIYFSVQLNHDLETSYIIEYKREVCIPVMSNVIPFKCDQSFPRWLPVWIDVQNRTMVMNPFSSKATKESAMTETGEIELMSRQPCMCRSSLIEIEVPTDCQMWETCILNTMFIEYLQRDYYVHFRTNVSFIVSSAVSTILSLITLPLSIRLYKESGSTYIELK